MIDFEQLKIENQTYSEKIEERNEVNRFFIFDLFQNLFLFNKTGINETPKKN